MVEFAARILGDKGKVLDARIFKASAPAKDTKAPEAVAALDEAFTKAASDLVAWSVEKLSAVPADEDQGKPDDMKLDNDVPAAEAAGRRRAKGASGRHARAQDAGASQVAAGQGRSGRRPLLCTIVLRCLKIRHCPKGLLQNCSVLQAGARHGRVSGRRIRCA